jgi:hypothetical protein
LVVTGVGAALIAGWLGYSISGIVIGVIAGLAGGALMGALHRRWGWKPPLL